MTAAEDQERNGSLARCAVRVGVSLLVYGFHIFGVGDEHFPGPSDAGLGYAVGHLVPGPIIFLLVASIRNLLVKK